MGEVIYLTSLISAAKENNIEDNPSEKSSVEEEKVEGFALKKRILCALCDWNSSADSKEKQKKLDEWHEYIGAP